MSAFHEDIMFTRDILLVGKENKSAWAARMAGIIDEILAHRKPSPDDESELADLVCRSRTQSVSNDTERDLRYVSDVLAVGKAKGSTWAARIVGIIDKLMAHQGLSEEEQVELRELVQARMKTFFERSPTG